MKKSLAIALTLALGALALAAEGEKVYQTYCMSCHQANGKGIPGAFPPLAEVVPEILEKGVEGRQLLIHVVLFGLQGQINVAGATYNSMMPPFGNQLSDEQVAAVLDYIAKAWGNDKLLPKEYKPFTPDEVKAERGKKLSPMQVYEEWKKLAE